MSRFPHTARKEVVAVVRSINTHKAVVWGRLVGFYKLKLAP